jgi:diguanylate cyclase (GGDEF)-like protein/PAS domain S-box-containing protein
MLLRFATLVFFILLGCAGSASADGPVDVGGLSTKTDITSLLRRLSTDESSVRVEMPPDPSGKSDVIDLQSKGEGPPFKWAIIALVNKSTAARNLVLSFDHQKFPGSRLVYPLPPGSIVENLIASGGSALSKATALGQDAFEFMLAPQATQSVAIQLAGEPHSVILWDRGAYDVHARSFALLQGAILGISILITFSLFLLFAARAKLAFLWCAIFAAASVAFMSAEVGYLSQPLPLLAGVQIAPAEARAAIETFMAIGLLLCLSSLADMRRSLPLVWNIVLAIAAFGLALAVYGFVEPLMVSCISRIAFVLIVAAGFLALVRQRIERPIEPPLLVWSVIVVWTFIASMAAFSTSGGDIFSLVLMIGLMVSLIFLSLHFFRSAVTRGFLTRHQTQELSRRDLALAGAQQYVWDYYPAERELYVSEELELALGHPQGTFSQSNIEALYDLMHPTDRDAYATMLADAERNGRGLLSQEFRLRRADGTYRWFELRARGIGSAESRLIRCIGTLSDVTNSKRIEERLLRDAVYDQVTGLPNRALFLDRLKREMAKPKTVSLYVILIDIDRFKTVNDGLGHEVGDSVLTSLGRRIEAVLGPNDTVARLPGDQFAVLFTETISTGDVSIFADSIHETVARPLKVNQHEIFLTACLGAASYREEGATPEQLMKDAAIALYEAKRRGKEMFAIFQPSMRDDRGELVALEAELRRALERNEIEVHYQPIARVADMDLAGFEALVRWRHPVLGLLAPESFLGLAEQTGMINEIGRFVLNEAAHQLGIWQRAFRPTEPVFMAVNVSAGQLLETDLVLDVRAAISREAVYKQTLKIEITESVIMQFPEKATGILELIKQLGVGLACDDFGTGYSSLSSLRDLPFDTLKIDRSFIVPEAEDERAAVILESIISLAHDLGLLIVAEGVEDQAQLDRLGALRCDFVQGFFIGLPMTAKQITESLGGMPYVKAYGKTALSTLWERAGIDPEALANGKEFTTNDIVAALEKQEQEIAAVPEPGLSPMAPRTAKLEPIELPSIFKTADAPVKELPKPKKKPSKKSSLKKRAPKPSSMP